jgi:hypothetical protein
MEAPPHSLHCHLIRSCWQMEDPPHSLQFDFWRPCSQFLPVLLIGFLLPLLITNGAGGGCGNIFLPFLIIGFESRSLNLGSLHLFRFLSSQVNSILLLSTSTSDDVDEPSSCELSLSAKTRKETVEASITMPCGGSSTCMMDGPMAPWAPLISARAGKDFFLPRPRAWKVAYF